MNSIRLFFFALSFFVASAKEPYEYRDDLFEEGAVKALTVSLQEEVEVILKVQISHLPDEDHPDFSLENPSEDVEAEVFLNDQVLYYKGKPAKAYQYPNSSYVSQFELTWDGKKIEIAEMFWNDLFGLNLSRLKRLRESANETEQFAFEEMEKSLLTPKLSLSSSAGTVLISWTRPED